MRDDIHFFEYGGYKFQAYAKYNAPLNVFEEFINYDTIDFADIKFNSKDFYKQSPVKNYDVFYCLDNNKFYIPKETRLCEYDEPTVAKHCHVRMVNDYEILHSFYVGEREVIVGEDKNAEYRYFCGYYENNDLFARAVNCYMCNDYLEVMQIYCDRTKEQIELCRSQQIECAELITADMCNPCQSDTNLTNKVVVLKPETLPREYQNGNHQLFYVTGGNGSRPNSIGTKVFGYQFGSKKGTYIRRYDIIGTMETEKLPEWAKKYFAQIRKNKSMEERI